MAYPDQFLDDHLVCRRSWPGSHRRAGNRDPWARGPRRQPWLRPATRRHLPKSRRSVVATSNEPRRNRTAFAFPPSCPPRRLFPAVPASAGSQMVTPIIVVVGIGFSAVHRRASGAAPRPHGAASWPVRDASVTFVSDGMI